jgi:hypothetical protein
MSTMLRQLTRTYRVVAIRTVVLLPALPHKQTLTNSNKKLSPFIRISWYLSSRLSAAECECLPILTSVRDHILSFGGYV